MIAEAWLMFPSAKGALESHALEETQDPPVGAET